MLIQNKGFLLKFIDLIEPSVGYDKELVIRATASLNDRQYSLIK